MEIRKTEDGTPVFHVFFKASAESWYYFGIEDNRLLIHSGNADFNSMISKRTNAGKAKIGEVAFIPGSEEETVTFINRFRKQYLGIDVPYSQPGVEPDIKRDPAKDVTEKKEEVPSVEPDKKKEEAKEEDDGF
jgi:hypothetical protein